MLVKQEFKVDLIDLKNARDAAGVLESIKQSRAVELGKFIVEKFPYVKNEEKSFVGELPEMSLNREHHFNDHYEQRLVIFREQDFRDIIKQLESEAEELIQDKDSEDEAYLRIAKSNLLKYLIELP